jgi:tetratricopeptide (TPR) repeat protein
MPQLRLTFIAGLLAVSTATAALADDKQTAARECFEGDNMRRIEACSDLLQTENLAPEVAALAYATRALAFSLRHEFDKALPDYDRALRIKPNFAVALNNRAWALFRSGSLEAGLADVQRSLALSPDSAHALDTRAHILQSQGKIEEALRDYHRAVRYGGSDMVKLYQCGLQAHGLYTGDIDGRFSDDLNKALETCVADRNCDPLPADEECRKVTS